MSPNNPGNFVNDLVEMAKAFEALPKVQAQLEKLQSQLEDAFSKSDAIANDLEQSRAYAASLEQKVRDAEVAKDQAETMFLEADDRTSRALDFIKATFGNAGSLIQALEPAPVKVAEPQPQVDDPSLPAEPEGLHTTHPSEPQSPSFEPEPTPSKPEGGWTAPSPASEVAQPHPTSNASTNSAEAKPEPVSASAIPEADVSGPVDQSFASPGRYSGKTYSTAKRDAGGMWDWPNQDEWLAGGGTTDNFFA